MRYIRGLCFSFWALLACSVQADTIPTLTAISASLSWTGSDTGQVSGPDFNLVSYATYSSSGYPCSTPVPAGGCVAPGPMIFLHYPSPFDFDSGTVTLGGIAYAVYFEGNAQIQYLTPTIVYPDPSTSEVNKVTVPVVLSGSETACLAPPGEPGGDPCVSFDSYGRPLPGYPDYLANISISVPGTLTIYANGPSNHPILQDVFTSVPEPQNIALASIGLLVLLTRHRVRRRRTAL